MTISNISFLTASNIGSFRVVGEAPNSGRLYDGTALEATLYGDVAGAGIQWVPDNFTWMHYHIYEPITASANQLGFPLDINWANFYNGAYNAEFLNYFYINTRPTYLNTILNKRNGPYGWPMWKQLRVSDHPIVRWQRENNEIVFLEPAEEKIVAVGNGYASVKAMRSGIQTHYTEPAISKRNASLIIGLGDGSTDNLTLVQTSFGNNLSTFSNKALSVKTLSDKSSRDNPQLYNALQEAYSGQIPNSPLNGQFQFMLYNEQVYPQDTVVYQDSIRRRSQFVSPYWSPSRASRSTISNNSQGNLVGQSIWALDGRDNFTTANCVTGGLGYEGELQNNYTQFFQTSSFDPNWMGNSNPYVMAFNTGSILTTFTTVALREGVDASGSWDHMIGTANGVHFRKFSVSAWVYSTPCLLIQPNRQTIIEFGDGTNASTRGVYLTTGSGGVISTTRRLAFSASYNALPDPGESNEWCSYTTADGGTEFADNTWHHVAVTFDPLQAAVTDRVTMYLNGSALAHYPANPSDTQWNLEPITFDAAGKSVAMIGSGSFVASPFMGMMSDIAIYSGSLSAGQVAEIFNGGAMRSLYQLTSKDQLVSWWRLGGGAGLVTASGDVNLVGVYGSAFTKNGLAYVQPDSIDENFAYACSGPPCILTKNHPGNRIFDMIGTNPGTPTTASQTSARLISAHTLTGSADATRTNIDYGFKVGALYARHEPEYQSTPNWLTHQISCSQGIRLIRVTGSRVFAGDSEWLAGNQSGLDPVYKSYPDFSNDIRVVGQEYSIIPEFRISEHMDYYLNTAGGDFLADNEGFLTLTGSTLEDSTQGGFFSTYSHSDFLQYFDIFKEDHKDIATPSNLKLRCQAVMKFLPYEGFYPAQRTLQLATLFSQSYSEYVKNRGWASTRKSSWRAFFSPFFAPGLLYNSIKSGLAVDYPIYTEDYPETIEDFKSGIGSFDSIPEGYEHLPWRLLTLGSRSIFGWSLSASANQHISQTDLTYWNGGAGYTSAKPYSLMSSSYTVDGNFFPIYSDASASWATVLASPFSKRIPFEGLVEPENYVAKNTIWDMEPDYSASLRTVINDPSTNQAAFWGGRGKLNYKLAMHNFLATVPQLFLDKGKFTTFTSNPIPPQGILISEDKAGKFYGMDVTISNSQCASLTDWRQRSDLPEFSTVTDFYYPINQEELDEVKGVDTQMYSRDSAFGPPWTYPASPFTSSATVLSYHYSYEPFTPAYFNGYGTARMLFYPFKGAGYYTIDEIQTHLTTSYLRMPTDRLKVVGTWLTNQLLDYSTKMSIDQNLTASAGSLGITAASTDANILASASSNWQHLDATVDLLSNIKVKNVTYEQGVIQDFTPVSFSDDATTANSVWAIQPKFETPILNFHNAVTSSTIAGQGSGSISKGMWHQYGDVCKNTEGIWLSIADLPNTSLLSKGYVPGTSTPHGYTFTGQKESTIRLENKNAYVDLFIRDYTALGADSYITIDGATLNGDGTGYTPLTNNLITAERIANAINSCKYTTGADPTGSQLQYRVQAIAYSCEDDYPWVDNLGPSTTAGPVAAVRISIRNFATTSSYDKFNLDIRYSNELNYPDYYAAGKLGNDKTCVIAAAGGEVDDSAWLLRGDKTHYRVNFANGTTPEYEVESLASLLGFPKTRKRLGEISNENTLSEAVIAIPFIENSGRKNFFRLEPRDVELALERRKAVDGETVSVSISQMISTLKDYVLPPKFDFITNSSVSPIAMYVFEFSYKLTKDDLKNIWQNLPPQLATSFEKKDVIIDHPLLEKELLDANDLSNLRWMVFKVKRKAAWNYYEATADTTDDKRFKFKQFEDTGGVPSYSYNWPYDFCSIVELAKIGAEVTFIKGTSKPTPPETVTIDDRKKLELATLNSGRIESISKTVSYQKMAGSISDAGLGRKTKSRR